MRPRKRYVIINLGKVETVIYDGLQDAARRVAHLKALQVDYSACWLSFKSQTAAEEFICWWQYEREAR